jgi:Na+/phosphate symporter
MEEKEYTATISEILDAVKPILDDTKRCIFSHDKGCLDAAEKKRRAILTSSLPMTEAIVSKQQKSQLEIRFLGILPHLQKLGINLDDLLSASYSKITLDVAFTEKALKEISDMIAGVNGLARDTKDFFVTKNAHLSEQIQTAAGKLGGMADEFALVHQQRLIVGLCSPKASYLYLDIIESLKRVTRELALIAEKA